MRVIERDITTVEEGIVAHQVNCQGAIGAGVSGAMCRKWPEAERAYRAFCAEAASPESLLGSFCHVDVAPGLTVVHVFGQLDYGDAARTGRVYTDVDALAGAMRHLCADALAPVYVPYGMGCGLAGADWSDVERALEGLPITACRLP